MSIIEATSVGVKTMADDTLRLTVDIDPRYAQEAFKLFGMRGAPIALARLTPQAAQESAQKATEKHEAEKGGALARLAGMWCADSAFWEWANRVTPALRLNPIASEHDAAAWLRGVCQVKSRAEIDNNMDSARLFHTLIREPYSEWLKGR